MPWLVREGKVLATLEIAEGMRERTHGLLGRDGVDGAVLLRPARSVHTIGMRFPSTWPLSIATCRVLTMVTMRPNRVSMPVWRARAAIEAEAGAFGSWGLQLADRLEIRGARDGP